MTFDLQSKWVARVLSGKILLPDEEEQMVSTKEFYRRLEELGVPKRFTHVLNPTGVTASSLHFNKYVLLFSVFALLMYPCNK